MHRARSKITPRWRPSMTAFTMSPRPEAVEWSTWPMDGDDDGWTVVAHVDSEAARRFEIGVVDHVSS